MLALSLVSGVPLDAPLLAFLLAFVFGFLYRGRGGRKKPRDFIFGYIHPETGDRVGPQEKQRLAHVCPADITFYGGAAGGGKSEFLIVEAVTTCIENDRVQVAIFRRTHKELLESLVERFLELVPNDIAKFSRGDMCARFKNGSILWFCHCQREASVYRYQSAQWVMLGIDEASHFTENQVLYLMTRVRSVRRMRKRIIFTSNPGNVGHGWLKRWFIRPVPEELGMRPHPEPYEVWRPLPLPHNRTPPEQMKTRCFIPARFEDNPALALKDPTYMASIYALGGDRAKQLAEGDWDANDEMIVGPVWRSTHAVLETDRQLLDLGYEVGQIIPWHVIPIATWRPPADALIFGSVDYGYGAPWSFHLHAALPDGHTVTFFEFYKKRVKDADQAKRIRAAIERMMKPREQGGCSMQRPQWIVLEPMMYGSREERGLAKSIAEVYEEQLGLPLGIMLRQGAAGESARMSRPNRWLDALTVAPDGLPWWCVTTACPDLIRTVPEVPWDPESPDVEDDRSENHAYEDVGRFFEARPHNPLPVPPDVLAGLDPISRAHQQHRLKRTQGHGKRKLTGRALARS